MRIIFAVYNYKPQEYDPEVWLEKINFYTGILEELALHAEVINIDVINWQGEFQRNGVRHLFVKAISKISVNKRILRLKPDIVVINGFAFPLEAIHLQLSKEDTKVVLNHHAERPVKGIRRILQWMVNKTITAYWFTSKEVADEWIEKKLISRDKRIFFLPEASSIYAPIDKPSAKHKTKVAGSPNFLWVGRLDENKDPLTVIKAFKKYIKGNSTAKLYLIYKADDLIKEVKELADEVKENIILVGKVSRDELLYWYNSTDYIICSSYYEGGNISVIEAMSCGCIPIVTKIPSFNLHTNYGKIGFQFSPGNVEELCEVLNKTELIDFSAKRLEVLSYFQQELSFKAIAEKLFRALNEL